MNNQTSRRAFELCILVAMLLLAASMATKTHAAEPALPANLPAAGPTDSATLEWFEPRGLNIVDLVGQVPEKYLAGSIISYTPGYGIVRYASGQRIGNTVVVTTTVFPRFVVDGNWNASMFGCLGQPAKIDQLGSVSPPTTIRIWNGAQDITREASLYYYVPAGLTKPIRNPVQSEQQNLYRYYESPMQNSSFTSSGELIMPANMGCEIMLSYRNYPQLTVVFKAEAPPVIAVTVSGYQDFVFHSYLGVGYGGHLSSLVNQLRGAGYPDRHEKLPLAIPAGANYFWLNFPPMPADAYTAFPNNPTANIDRPTAGTYRFVIAPGLSVDHVNSMGLPLYGHWQDSSQAGGQYLNYTREPLLLAVPEYFLPPGVSYQPCMTYGGCSADLLKQVYNTTATMRALYLRVERTATTLNRYATQMVGPAWSPTLTTATEYDVRHAPDNIIFNHFTFLPLLLRTIPPDDASGCSLLGGCGWFTADGRMVNYIPMP